MTEAEWLACADPQPMLRLLIGKMSWRKRALFACAYCGQLANPFAHPWQTEVRSAVEAVADEMLPISTYRKWTDEVTAERTRLAELTAPIPREYSGGEEYLEDQELTPGLEATHALVEALYQCVHFPDLKPDWLGLVISDWQHWACTLKTIGDSGLPRERVEELIREDETIQATLLRDLFGNPFRPVGFSPEWRTDTVAALARQMYDSRDFSAMPILADALQDAGCDNDDILNHCRSGGVHVRGCWVVDLALGKE